MGRNIVFCLDGTSNKYAAVNTNVLKLYAMLDKRSDQLGYYQPGIGTFAPPGTLSERSRTSTWSDPPGRRCGGLI